MKKQERVTHTEVIKKAINVLEELWIEQLNILNQEL